jgi:DNA polymerase-3 subunit delta'
MPGNWDLIGHEWAVQLLRGQIAGGQVRHAYLFTGSDGIGRRTLALRLAQALNCTQPPAAGDFCGECRACRGFAAMQHADLYTVERQEGDKEIKVGAVRELTRSLSRTPLEARYQIGLLLDFEKASEEAANAMLKTLEEPNPSVILCLTATDTDSIPGTIASRCEIIRLRPVPAAELAAALTPRLQIASRAELLASLSGGRPGEAIRLHQQPDLLDQRSEWLDMGDTLLKANRVERFAFAEKASKDREALRTLLLVWLSFWRDVLLRVAGSASPMANVDREAQLKELCARLDLAATRGWVSALEGTLEQLTTNVNARLALEVLLLELPSL